MHLSVVSLLLSILVLHVVASEEVAVGEKVTETEQQDSGSLSAAVEGKTLGVVSPAYGVSYGGYGVQAPLQHAVHARQLTQGIVNVSPYLFQQQQLQPQQFQMQFRQVARQVAPITIPFIDKNGCRFPGDIVCAPEENNDNGGSYGLCVLTNENKNLWKKPSMQVRERQCEKDTRVLFDWCNNNERLMRATGFIQRPEELQIYNHQKKYFVMLSPCMVAVVPPYNAAA